VALGSAASVVLLAFTLLVVLGAHVVLDRATTAGVHRIGGGARVTLRVQAYPGFGFEALRDEYAEIAPNVTLDLVESDYDELAEQLQDDLDRGTGAPDLVAIDLTSIGQFSTQPDRFLDLRRLPGGARREQDFLPWLWQRSLGPDGQQIALPGYAGGDALCYRRDLFERAGLPTDREAVGRLWQSWPQFVQVARRYTRTTGKPFLDNVSGLYQTVLMQQPVGNFGRDGRLALEDGPRLAWDTLAPLTAPGISARLDAYEDGWEAGLRDGAFAVAECPYWMLQDIRDAAPQTFGQWDIAAVPGVGGNWGAGFLAIPAQGRHPAAAWRLLQWITRPAQQASRFRSNRELPCSPAGLADLAVRERLETFFNAAPVGRIYGRSVQAVPTQYPDPADEAVTSDVMSELWSVEHGQEKLSEGWAAAVAAVHETAGLDPA
jgi:cellobiose transport system substrate-binding protein